MTRQPSMPRWQIALPDREEPTHVNKKKIAAVILAFGLGITGMAGVACGSQQPYGQCQEFDD